MQIKLQSKWKRRFHSILLSVSLPPIPPPLAHTSIQPTNQILKLSEQEWQQNMEREIQHQVSTNGEFVFLNSLTQQLEKKGREQEQHRNTTISILRE